jgi:hypothetical protein
MNDDDARAAYWLWCRSDKGRGIKNDYNEARKVSGYTVWQWSRLRDRGRELVEQDRKPQTDPLPPDEVNP